MKKRLLSMIVAVAMTFTLVSCSGNSSKKNGDKASGSDKEVITVWAWDPNFNIAIMNEAKAIYEKENENVTIEVIDFAKTDVEQKLHTLLASGTTKDLPEIVLIEDYNAQKFLQSYPGAFKDLTSSIPYEDFADYKKTFMTVDDKSYGVPFDSGVTGYYYRIDMLVEAGFAPEDLENITWDRFIEIGKVVKEKTGKPMLSLDPSDLGLLRAMLNSAGTWYCNENGEPYFAENKAMIEGINLMKTLLDTGVASMHSGWADFTKGFNSGAVVGVPTGVWITPSVEQESSQSGLWKVAPIPRLNIEGSTNVSNLGGSSWYVLENSDVSDAAVDFLADVYTKNEFYETILTNNAALTAYLPSTGGAAYKEESEFFSRQAIYEHFSNWMKEVPVINYGMYTYEAEAILAPAFNDILNGKDINEALKSVEEQVKMQIQ